MTVLRTAALPLAIIAFVTVLGVSTKIGCYYGIFLECNEVLFSLIGLAISGIVGAIILIINYCASSLLRRTNWYRSFYDIALYPVLSVTVTRLYLYLTGSKVDLIAMLDRFEIMLAISVIAMSGVMLLMWYPRSNKTSMDAPVKSSE